MNGPGADLAPRERRAVDVDDVGEVVGGLDRELAPRERRAVAVDGFVHALASRRQDPHQLIVDTIAGAVAARRAVLAVCDHAGGRLTVAATRGSPIPPVTGSVIAPGAGITGRTFATRRPRLVSDAAGEPAEPWLPSRGGSCISVPLVARESALGVITLADRAGGRRFDRADLSVVRGLAATAALALAYERVVQAKHRLEQAVAVDPLTGLFNRRCIDARLREELERARRHRGPVALIAIDVDRFKSLNDALGHPAGDAVLRGLAAIFRRSVRAFDICARFGGDEFAIVMPRGDDDAAARSAERIRRRVQDYWPEAVSPRPAGLRITASFGVVVSRPDTTPSGLVERADRALYAAKANGRNRVHLGAGA